MPASIARSIISIDDRSPASPPSLPHPRQSGADLHTGPAKRTIFHPQNQLSPYSNQQGH